MRLSILIILTLDIHFVQDMSLKVKRISTSNQLTKIELWVKHQLGFTSCSDLKQSCTSTAPPTLNVTLLISLIKCIVFVYISKRIRIRTITFYIIYS